jgi:hypothetical protein
MRWKLFLLAVILCLFHSTVLGQTGEAKETPNLLAVMQDAEGGTWEGYLRSAPKEIAVSSQDHQEKTIPFQYIKSITLEKIKAEGPLADPKQEARYSVRLQNSQEIYTLREKYTFSLNTRIGVVTRTIDPDMIHDLFSKDASETQTMKSDRDEPFIQDKSIVFSLELKF